MLIRMILNVQLGLIIYNYIIYNKKFEINRLFKIIKMSFNLKENGRPEVIFYMTPKIIEIT